GTVQITNSTLADNAAFGGAGYHTLSQGGSGLGGAVFNLNGSLTIVNSTLAANSVAAGSGTVNGVSGSAGRGAVYTLGMDGVLTGVGGSAIGSAAAAQVKLINSLFANSTGGLDFVNNNSTILAASSNNLATQSTGLPTGFISTTTAALNLGSLGSNGGPT